MGRRHSPIVLVVVLLSFSLAGSGNAGNANSSSAPGQAPPSTASLPSIAGVTLQGQTLSANDGTWSGPSPSYSVQWVRCDSSGSACSPISGATAESLLLTSADLGGTLRIVVTASNKNGSTVVTSGPTTVVTQPVAPPPAATTTTTSGSTTSGTTTTTTTPTTTTSGTTTTTTPTTSPPLYAQNFESGLGASGWTYQCYNTGLTNDTTFARGNIYVVSDIVGQGLQAGRVDLPASTTQKTACEALHARTLDPGSDDYYALDLRFPTNWTEPGDTSLDPNAWWGMVVAQFNYELIWGAPVALEAHSNRLDVSYQGGFCSSVYSSNPGCTYSNGGGEVPANVTCAPSCRAIPAGQLTLGVWHQLIVHVHWTTDSSGLVEIWHRVKGESAWTKTVTISGYPTIQTSVQYPSGNPSTTDKFGAYRPVSPVPLSVWHDGWCRATSFDAAQACLS